jgi:sugar/nucleoside kinase (ribokinase family)
VRPVVVVGDLMVDVVARLGSAITPGSDTPARIRTRPGGSAANVAAWLAEAGTAVTLVARAGDDAAARRALDGLRPVVRRSAEAPRPGSVPGPRRPPRRSRTATRPAS